jgi:hypothetical protein
LREIPDYTLLARHGSLATVAERCSASVSPPTTRSSACTRLWKNRCPQERDLAETARPE